MADILLMDGTDQ